MPIEYICFIQTQPKAHEGPMAEEVSQTDFYLRVTDLRLKNPGFRPVLEVDLKTHAPATAIYLREDKPLIEIAPFAEVMQS